MATALPTSTHFYLNFLILQCPLHFLQLTRWMQVLKFLAFSRIFKAERARELAEPEGQAFNGVGSRSARFTIQLLIGVVYTTISPLCSVTCFLNFATCRLVYGYLMVYAEGRKADLGGVFWATQLGHVYIGVLLHNVVVTGILSLRAQVPLPALIALPSIPYCLLRLRRWHRGLQWEKLPFKEYVQGDFQVPAADKQVYVQPELLI